MFSSFLANKKATGILMACAAGSIFALGISALSTIRGTRDADGAMTAIKHRIGMRVESTVKPLDEIVPLETMRAAIESGAKVVGGDGKKTLVNVDGRVFAYDKSSGRLMQSGKNPYGRE